MLINRGESILLPILISSEELKVMGSVLAFDI